ncbi:MAG: penicillin-binding transpeptidase domain-containing protein [Alphaproteobacteria bacterium]
MALPKIPTVVKRATSLLFMLAAFVAIGGVVYYRLADLQHRAAVPPKALAATDTEDSRLFFDLLRTKLLKPRPDGGLEMAPSDFVQARTAKGQKETDPEISEQEQARLLRVLYDSNVGTIVRQQVRLWNDTRLVAAIRDDVPNTLADANASEWQAFNATGHPLRTVDQVPEQFGFIHKEELKPGFGPWLAVTDNAQEITFRGALRPGNARTVTIQVVGTPVRLPPGARVEKREGDFGAICPLKASAAIITLPVAANARGTQVSVSVQPSPNCAARLFGLAIRLERDKSGKFSIYKWRPVGRLARNEAHFTIRTSDDVLLTDPAGKGRPAKAAAQLNLLNLVGFGPSDAASVIGVLAQSRLPPARNTEITLTVDSKIQKAAQDALKWGMTRIPAGDKYAGERKVSIVVLDADTGAILGTANWPAAPEGAQPWDYASFAAANPLRDPMSMFAWEVIDKNNTPGSTFKTIAALAYMRQSGALAAQLKRVMLGLDPASLTALTGLNPGASAYNPNNGRRSIANFGHGNMLPYFGRSYRDSAGCKVPPIPNDGRFGLTQGIQFSLNVWFARLAVMLDEGTVDEYIRKLRVDKNAPPPPTRMIQHLRWLGLDDQEKMDLGVNVPPSFGLHRDKEGTDILYAQVARQQFTELDFETNNPAGLKDILLFVIAQNGIGQSVSFSPLHMARGVASIASGKRIQPHIFSKWGNQTLPVPDAPKLDADPELLQLLRNGMKGVPEVGTAAGAFIKSTDFRCRTYGKTGTAEIDKGKSFNSGWFIGWMDPDKPGGRKLAFSCMATHAFGALRTGGAFCAPMINKMLELIVLGDKAPKDPTEPPPKPGEIRPADRNDLTPPGDPDSERDDPLNPVVIDPDQPPTPPQNTPPRPAVPQRQRG